VVALSLHLPGLLLLSHGRIHALIGPVTDLYQALALGTTSDSPSITLAFAPASRLAIIS
jgi:hypothetical protein